MRRSRWHPAPPAPGPSRASRAPARRARPPRCGPNAVTARARCPLRVAPRPRSLEVEADAELRPRPIGIGPEVSGRPDVVPADGGEVPAAEVEPRADASRV